MLVRSNEQGKCLQRAIAKVGRLIKAYLLPSTPIVYPDKMILLVSLQKCGTHLIEKVFDEAGLERKLAGNIIAIDSFQGLANNNYIRTHFSPADNIQAALEEDKKVYIVFNYRDPRDVLVSWFHWVHPNNPKPMHSHMRYMQKVYANFSDDELINIFLTNDKFREVEYNPLEAFRHSRVLLYHPRVLNVRFEDLVGAQGAGNRIKQVETIRKIYNYLEIADVDPERVADTLFSKDSPTFHKGQIGAFWQELSADQLRVFYQLHGDILRQYGYE